jgi:hypothetical protein
MRSSSNKPYPFDRLFMSHLGSRLRPEYDPLVRSALPPHYWELLLDLELAKAERPSDENRTAEQGR